MVEKDGKTFDMFCPGNSTTLAGKPFFQKVDENNKPVSTEHVEYASEYVYTKCGDNHWTWISKKSMSDSKDFESANDPSVNSEEQ